MNREYFFNRIRQSVFGGKMTQPQVEGVTNILDYRDKNWPKMSDDELAYLLATVVHETAHKMQPIREMGGERYLRSKKYYPWVGEGLVQVTWKENAVKFGAKKPGDLLTWPIALRAAFEGMIKGMFTGKKLADYINKNRVDYVGARRIINGTDRAKLVAGYARAFRDALKQANQ
jgi:putative chitinase